MSPLGLFSPHLSPPEPWKIEQGQKLFGGSWLLRGGEYLKPRILPAYENNARNQSA